MKIITLANNQVELMKKVITFYIYAHNVDESNCYDRLSSAEETLLLDSLAEFIYKE